MKKYFLYVAVVAVALLIAACTKSSSVPTDESVTGIITMTTQASEVEFVFPTWEEILTINLDWGDGEISEINDGKYVSDKYSKQYLVFSHIYSNTSAHNITITSSFPFFNLSNMQLTNLDVSHYPALTGLWCFNNQLTTLDVSRNRELVALWCHDNRIATLDVSSNTELTNLWCGNNQLSTLDVSRNTALTSFYCDNNQLTTLDVNHNTELMSLVCNYNYLATLDVSHNPALQYLHCPNNQLTTLDVSHNFDLYTFDCSNNQLTASSLNCLFRTLPHNNSISLRKFIYITDNPGASDCDVSIAEEKRWTVYNLANITKSQAITELFDFDDRIFEENRWRQWYLDQNSTEDRVELYLNFLEQFEQFINNNNNNNKKHEK